MQLFAFTITSTFFSPAAFNTFGQLMTIIIGTLTALTGAATAVFVVIAGIKFITSSGDPKNIASARATLTYALIGLAVTILAFVILQVTQYFLGVKNIINSDGTGGNNGGGGGGSVTLSSSVNGSTVNFSFSPSDGSYVVIADTDCAFSSIPRDYDSGQLAPGTTSVQFNNAQAGNYCAKIVKALSGATLSGVINFSVATGPITLTAAVNGNTIDFTFSPSDGSYVVIADTDCTFSSIPRDYDSGQLAPGRTIAQFRNAPVGTYCAKIVKALSGATLSNVITFNITPAAQVGTTWLTVNPSGSTVTITWPAIPNWPTGTTYFLGIYPNSATGCPPTSGNIITQPFTSGAGGSYTIPSPATPGSYIASLFTSSQTPLSNCPMFRLYATYALTCGMLDFNNDRSITTLDLNILANNYGLVSANPARAKYDLNKDGNVNVIDMSILSLFVGQSC